MKPAITEKAFQAQVVELARYCGWKVYHTFDSRKSDPGFKDLVMVRGKRLIFSELKSEKGRETPAQVEWSDALELVAIRNEWVENHLWRPSDWPEIERVLRRR